MVWGPKEEVSGEMQIQVILTLQHLQIKMQPHCKVEPGGGGGVTGRPQEGRRWASCFCCVS